MSAGLKGALFLGAVALCGAAGYATWQNRRMQQAHAELAAARAEQEQSRRLLQAERGLRARLQAETHRGDLDALVAALLATETSVPTAAEKQSSSASAAVVVAVSAAIYPSAKTLEHVGGTLWVFLKAGEEVLSGNDTEVSRWDTRSGKVLGHFAGRYDFVERVNGALRLITEDRAHLRLWDLTTGQQLASVDSERLGNPNYGGETHYVGSFSVNGRYATVTPKDEPSGVPAQDKQHPTICVDTKNGKEVPAQKECPPANDELHSRDSAIERELSTENTLWDVKPRPRADHSKSMGKTVVAEDGQHVFVYSQDHAQPPEIRNTKSGKRTPLKDQNAPVWEARILSGTQRQIVVVVSVDGRERVLRSLRVYSLTTGEVLMEPLGMLSPSLTYELSHTGRFLAMRNSAELMLYDLEHRGMWLVRQESGIDSVHFTPDDRALLTTNFDGEMQLHAVRDGSLLARLSAHKGRIRSAVFSTDSQRLITLGEDDAARLWSVRTQHALRTVRGPTFSEADKVVPLGGDKGSSADIGMPLATSRDGRLVAIYEPREGGLGLWEAKAGQRRLLIAAQPRDAFVLAAISADGEQVAALTRQGTLSWWDTHTAALRGQLRVLDEDHTGMAYAPEGDAVLIGARDGTAQAYATTPQPYMKRSCERLRGHPEFYKQVENLCQRLP